jgi:ribosomal-protein-alanine N-acetyltransferase
VERKRDHRLLGFTGLGKSDFDAPFCPAVDIGWQPARDALGQGDATEGASPAVMRRVGMTHNPADDFDGPWYRPGHPRRRFVLYRLQASEWPPAWLVGRSPRSWAPR